MMAHLRNKRLGCIDKYDMVAERERRVKGKRRKDAQRKQISRDRKIANDAEKTRAQQAQWEKESRE